MTYYHGKRNGAKYCSDKSYCDTSKSTDCYECYGDSEGTCEESCPRRCDYKLKKGYDPMNLFCKMNTAVVRITSEFQFTTATDPDLNPLDGLNYESNLETVYKTVSGFRITRGVIICPAHGVLTPPDYTLGYNQWPFTADQINAATIQSQVMRRANRIAVDVFDVNGKGRAYKYDATLIGVSGIGDIAVIVIDHGSEHNKGLPCIKKCHPHFRFGCSRKYRPGVDVYAIGDALSRSSYRMNSTESTQGPHGHVIVAGTVADHRYVDYIGLAQQELLAVNMPVYAQSAGLPLIDRYGCVIGMQTMNVIGGYPAADGVSSVGNNPTNFHQYIGDGLVAGPTQFFMSRIIMAILCPQTEDSKDYVVAVNDPVGDFIRYSSAYLGLAWEVMTGATYLSYRDGPTGEIRSRFLPGTTTGEYDPAPVDVREIIGLRVAGLTGDNTALATRLRGDIYLPGESAPGSDATHPWVDSPLRASGIELNDIITHMEKQKLGDLRKQVPASLVLFRRKVGDIINVTVRSFSSGYEKLTAHNVNAVRCPPFFDYPLYKYGAFPHNNLTLLSLFAAPLPVSPDADADRPASGPYTDSPVMTLPTI